MRGFKPLKLFKRQIMNMNILYTFILVLTSFMYLTLSIFGGEKYKIAKKIIFVLVILQLLFLNPILHSFID